MTNKIFYVLPRARKQRKRPVRLDQKPGAASLVANVIAVATNDYFCGDAQESNDARWYFPETYRQHVAALGLPGDLIPDAIRDRVIEVEL